MQKNVMLILVGKRRDAVTAVQDILTDMGCYIKIRLGVHDGSPDSCSDCGFIVLELIGDAAKHRELEKKLNAVANVTAKLVSIAAA